MKVIVLFQVVLIVVGVFGPARGDEEAVVTTSEIDCPVELNARNIVDKNIQCIVPSDEESIKENLKEATTNEEFQEILKAYCQTVPSIIECIVKTRDLADHCLSDRREYKLFKLQSKLIQLLVEVSCEQDGSRVLPILKNIFSSSNSSEIISDKCSRRTLSEAFGPMSPDLYGLMQYHMLKKFKNCVTEYVDKHNVDLSGSVEVLDETSERVICEEPVTNAEVLCKTIVERECLAHGDEHNDPSDATNFSDKAMDCFLANTDKTNIKQLLDTATTEDEYRSLFKIICETSTVVDQCHTRANLFGRLCLSGTDLDIFRGQTNLMVLLHDLACNDEGVRLSALLGELRSNFNSSNDISERCFQGAVTGLNHDKVEFYNYRLIQYQVMKNFKNCLADYGKEHSQALVSVSELLNEGLDRLTCYDSESDDDIQCNTIQHNLK